MVDFASLLVSSTGASDRTCFPQLWGGSGEREREGGHFRGSPAPSDRHGLRTRRQTTWLVSENIRETEASRSDGDEEAELTEGNVSEDDDDEGEQQAGAQSGSSLEGKGDADAGEGSAVEALGAELPAHTKRSLLPI